MTLTSSWANVQLRARLVHALACADADMSELASLADNDPAVLIAAIVYESEHALDYSVLSRSCVVHRLHVCLRSLIRQPVDAT